MGVIRIDDVSQDFPKRVLRASRNLIPNEVKNLNDFVAPVLNLIPYFQWVALICAGAMLVHVARPTGHAADDLQPPAARRGD
jgi:hypothetical protein